MTPIRSYLAGFVPSAPTDAETLETMRARAWALQGVVVIRPEEIADDWLRQAIINEATRRWGRRP